MQDSTEQVPFEFPTTVTEATVYTDRAMVTRHAKAQIETGSHTLYLDNLPDNLNEDSLRVQGYGSGSIQIQDFKIHRKHHREVSRGSDQDPNGGKGQIGEAKEASPI